MSYSTGGIKRFVRHTLGCTCSDDVFEHIDQSPARPGITDTPAAYRILIGNRLLVYLWAPDDIDRLARDLPAVVERGRHERDDHGYNRFRLVVLTHRPLEWQKAAEDLFRTIARDDAKLHLHLVDAADAAAVLR